MRLFSLLSLAVVLCGGFFFSIAAQQNQAESERYIVESEGQWAASLASGDVSALQRFLADDFLGVDPDGSKYSKEKAISETRTGPETFLSNHANEVKVRFYGDTAVAQGSESWERRSGEPRYGRYVWTDTWVRRNGKWQVVAAEDVEVADKNP
jgi:ketosteroid isomerase-like protein